MTTATADAPPRLRARHPKLDFSQTPKYWVLDDPQTTHSLNLLHFGIPAGERWFIDGVRLAMPYISDRRLLDDARGFIGQEATHARMHEKAAEHLQLFDIPRIRRAVALADSRRLALYKRVDSLPEPVRRQAVRWWLSGVMLGEHFTALFADLVFDETKTDEAAVDPEMALLLKWHAAEELEHRSLPYDVYEHVGGKYLMRVAVALPAFALLPLGLVQLTDFLMRQDPDLRRGFSLRDYVRAVRARRSPSLLDVVPRFVVYLLPNHHPSKIGHDERAAAYLASNPPSLTPAKGA
ncbi:MAG: metal-dependent hydrolase [Acidimicrobiales bacterium]